MLINFCYSDLLQSVSSDIISSEGFEVTNLSSQNLKIRTKGFLAERFVKPPVVLSFVLFCEVNINHIVILTSVGSQKSSGIEIFTECLNSTSQSVSSGVLNQSENGFVFHKHGDHIKHKLPDDYKSLSFRTFKSSRFLKTNVIKIKIFKTNNSTIPALGKVEIWGYPSRNCSNNIVQDVYKTWNRIQFEKDFISKPLTYNLESTARIDQPLLGYSDSSTLNSKMHTNRVLDLNSTIPEEFIDPITCEVMILPIILPCGKIIDSFTFEKHTEAESKWGRAPSDPFTGKLITDNHKTVFASDLKLRIDKFLCDHSNEAAFKTIPRTVGRKFAYNRSEEINLGKKSCLDFQGSIVRPNEDGNRTTLHFQNIGSTICKSKMTREDKQKHLETTQVRLIHGESSEKHTKEETNISNENNYLFSNSTQSSNSFRSKTIPDTKVSGDTQPLNFRNLSHEEKSEYALEHSLKRTLSTLSYSSKKVMPVNNTKCNKCFCKDYLFQLPCSHFMCRSCLLNIIESKCLKCFLCQAEFKKSDPYRFHL